MISNMESQLKQQGAGDRVKEVLAEVPKVRKDAGYPPLVTPSSQIVGTQAVFNVLMGRYKALTGEFADLMLGYYGETLGQRDPEVIKLAAQHSKKEPITDRPADQLKPEWEKLREQALALPGCDGTDEDVLTCRNVPPGGPEILRRPGRRPQERRQGPRRQTRRRHRDRRAGRQAGRRQRTRHQRGHLRDQGRREVPQGHRPTRLNGDPGRNRGKTRGPRK